jgi:hypothetical protein
MEVEAEILEYCRKFSTATEAKQIQFATVEDITHRCWVVVCCFSFCFSPLLLVFSELNAQPNAI